MEILLFMFRTSEGISVLDPAMNKLIETHWAGKLKFNNPCTHVTV